MELGAQLGNGAPERAHNTRGLLKSAGAQLRSVRRRRRELALQATAIGIVTVRRQVPKILLLLPRCRDKRTPQVFSGDGSGGLRKWYDRSGKKRGKPFHVRSPISVYLSGDARTTV
ncbi:MAG: hypothetical protein DMG10_06455 [Acidobacteria bacterium]|nr:MAG: hypothetical protein DMG10_06455 [Acidobacteriota bacterium]